jgi:hypothetical protein
MILKLIFLVAFVFVAVAALTKDEEDKLFQDFLVKFRIRLSRSGSQDDVKKKNFLQNYKIIQDQNQRFRNQSSPYQLDLNKYSILNLEEFVSLRTGLNQKPGQNRTSVIKGIQRQQNFRGSRNFVPLNFDWRKFPNVVREVQDQVSW